MYHIRCVCVCVCKESLWSSNSHNKHTILVDHCASDCRTEGERQARNISGWRIAGSIQRLWISRLFTDWVTVAEGVLLFFVSNEWTGDRWICWDPRTWVLWRTGVSILLEENLMPKIFRHLYLARSWSFPVHHISWFIGVCRHCIHELLYQAVEGDSHSCLSEAPTSYHSFTSLKFSFPRTNQRLKILDKNCENTYFIKFQ